MIERKIAGAVAHIGACALVLLLGGAGVATAQQPPRPHIVVLLADDLGWQDVGYHGSEISTPHIDHLAQAGVRLEQFYVQPVCSPTRSSLMTGRYPIRQGLQVGVIRPWADYGLPLEERMLPEALRQVGYRTAITGKWHLGQHATEYLPLRRGFDHQYGHYTGALDYFTHRRMEGLDWHRQDRALDEEGYTTELIGAEAARVIANHNPEQPLLLYVPFNAPHSPLQAPERYLDQYDHIQDQKRKIYAAMVTCLDDAVGRIREALREQGMEHNTLVLFSSDNGGPENLGANNGPLRGVKGTLYEGGVRVPAFAVWPAQLPAGRVVDEPLHIVDWYPTLLNLAGASLEQPLPLDGHDAWPTIAAGAASPHEEILHNATPDSGALRRGPWKLVLNGQQRGRRRAANEDQIELFHIEHDPAEEQNLADRHPEIAEQLRQRLELYRQQAVPPQRSAAQQPDNFQVPAVWGEQQ